MKNFYSLTIKEKKKTLQKGIRFQDTPHKDNIQMGKKWLISLVIKEIQIKATMSHYTPNLKYLKYLKWLLEILNTNVGKNVEQLEVLLYC